MGRPPKHSVETKLKIVLSVLSGEASQAEAARRHGVSVTSVAKWREQFLDAGRQGLASGDTAGRPSGREAQQADEIDDLTRALGEAHVRIRSLERGGAGAMGFR